MTALCAPVHTGPRARIHTHTHTQPDAWKGFSVWGPRAFPLPAQPGHPSLVTPELGIYLNLSHIPVIVGVLAFGNFSILK